MEETLKQPKKLTKKRQGFVKDYVLNGENGQEAAKANFDVSNDNSARAVASELLTIPNVIEAIEVERETLKSALEKEGVTPSKVAKKINALLDSEDEHIVDKGLKHATSIYGLEDDKEKPKGNTSYTFVFNEQTQEKIKAIEAEIKHNLLNA